VTDSKNSALETLSVAATSGRKKGATGIRAAHAATLSLTLSGPARMRALLLLASSFLGGVVASPLSYADTETIKLTCDLDVTTRPPAGDSKRSHETAMVELLFDTATGFKAIVIHSAAIPVAVANKKGGAVTAFSDNSDGNRWDISNRRDRTKVASDESAAIDRDTGQITAYSIKTVGDASQHVEARGTCARVDAGK
jgi:hypothetical protein